MTERLNVRRMQMPEKMDREDLPFDPQVEITKEDWEKVQQFISSSRSFRDTETSAISYAKIVDPHRVPEIPEEQLKRIEEHLIEPDAKQIQNDIECMNLLERAVQMKLLTPERTDILSASVMERVTRYISRWRQSSFHTLIEAAAHLKVIDSEFAQKTLISESRISDVQKELQIALDEARMVLGDYRWGLYVKLASAAKLLFPQISVDLIDLSSEDWDVLRERFSRNEKVGDRMRDAARLAIIEAHSVRITDKGIELTLRGPKQFKEQPQAMPEQLQI